MLVLFFLLDSSSSNVLLVNLAGEAELKQANTCPHVALGRRALSCLKR